MTEDIETEYLQMRHAREYGTGKFLYDVDHKWRKECEDVLVKVTEAKQANARPAPQPNADDLALLDRVTAARPNLYFSDVQFRGRVESLRVQVFNGQRIPADVRAATEADLAKHK